MADTEKAKRIKFLTNSGEPDALSTKYADIYSLKFLPENIKAHDRGAIKDLIRAYGFVEPIGINRRTGHVTSGNGRLECLLDMLSAGEKPPKGIIERLPEQKATTGDAIRKRWYVPIIDGLDFDEKEELELAIGINRASEKGGIDPIKAFPVLKRLLDLQDGSLERTGYDATSLEHLQRLHRFHLQMKANEESPDGIDASGETISDVSDSEFCEKLNKKWKVETGQRWHIGDHILVCGSCTDIVAFQHLIPSDEHVRLCFTSPPYDNQRLYETTGFNWHKMMCDATDLMIEYFEAPADIVINLGPQMSDGRYQFYWNEWLGHCATRSMPLYGFYVWDKGFGYPGEYHGRLASSHEFLFHFSLGHTKANKWIETTGATLERGPKNFSKRKEDGSLRPGYTSPDKLAQDYKIPDSVVRMFNEQARGIHTKGHPATFPVSLPEFMMQTWSNIGDIVYEPFAGSGTTIIAGQNLARKVRAMELNPNYCALILERLSIAFPDLKIRT